jgi:beta-galactosidase
MPWMKKTALALFSFTLFAPNLAPAEIVEPLVLNGEWAVSDSGGAYTRQVSVPGIVNDPAEMDDGPVWLKREVFLPSGEWTHASLLLKGARYNPAIHVNGDKVSFKKGGMGPRTHYLKHPDLKPGNRVTLEIELMSLADMSEDNASYTPKADHWRSSISAYIWDDVVLRFHGGAAIDRMIPFTDIHGDQAGFHVYPRILDAGTAISSVRAVISKDGKTVAEGQTAVRTGADNTVVGVPFGGKVELWSPDDPNLYQLSVSLLSKEGVTIDERVYPYGAKEFKLDASGKQFSLNGKPFKARAATVVWPRWVRNREGHELAWDEEWFEKNIVCRLKDLGANTLRFHLGNPPEKYIDLCDKHGLLVQYEWCFFHGMPATVESLLDQWPDWFDLGLRHPSVGLYHPYNETDPEWLDPAWTAINRIIKDYPPILIADRDVVHVHKYWWSLFENLGLYYDSHTQFPKAIMVDEFGGNYLDANYDPGLYKTVKDTFRRFLGEGETREQRIKLQTQANVKVAEYWRRIGAAGFSPFCALGSHEDGSHWFEGDLKEGNPKPVWSALAVAYSPIAASMELWDQNFEGGQSIEVPVYLCNDTDEAVEVRALLTVEQDGALLFKQELAREVPAFGREVVLSEVTLPVQTGDYSVKAALLNAVPEVKHPIVSEWDIRVLAPGKSPKLETAVLGIPEDEAELVAFAKAQGLNHVRPDDGEEYDILMLSRRSWMRIVEQEETLKDRLRSAVGKGRSVLLLDVGPQFLGQGYPLKEGDLGPLQGVFRLSQERQVTTHVFGNLSLEFALAPEPESHIHAHPGDDTLWKHLGEEDVWLWNGYRGGLVMPADRMEVLALGRESFLELWADRGADRNGIRSNPDYTAFAIDGYYGFSAQPKADQDAVIRKLRDQIRFIQQDAPAIAALLDPEAEIEIIKLNEEWSEMASSTDREVVVEPLARAGKGLNKVPVVKISTGGEAGAVMISQLLTGGRLARGFGSEGLYGVRYDPAAVQMVLNMLANLSK